MARADRVQPRSGGAGARLRGAGLRVSARRRSRRRLCRQAHERARRSNASSTPSAFAVQLGGGIRDMATIEGWLDKGVDRVIIGTAAVRDPALVKERREISRAGSRSGSMRATARSRSRAGPRPPS